MSLVVPVYVQHKDKPELRGVVVSEHLVPQVFTDDQGQQVIKQQPLLGVCWDGNPCPAIDYLSPYDLVLLGTAAEVDLDEDEDEEDDTDEEYDEDSEDTESLAPLQQS